MPDYRFFESSSNIYIFFNIFITLFTIKDQKRSEVK